MRFSATEISFGEAPTAVAVTAMRIQARGKRKGEGRDAARPPRKVNDSATSGGVGAGGSEGVGATGSPVPALFFLRPPIKDSNSLLASCFAAAAADCA